MSGIGRVRTVAEHEVLRIAATLVGNDPAAAATKARRAILAWAQNRSGGQLPAEAWSLETFEHLRGGRNSSGIRLADDDTDIWTIRADDPDKTVPDRIWTHEITIGLFKEQPPRFSVRQLVNTVEPSLSIQPHSPGFIRQVIARCGLRCRDHELSLDPWLIDSEGEATRLLQSLMDPARVTPIFVFSIDKGQNAPLLDVLPLVNATLGLARVVVLPDSYTWALSESLGKARSVFGGAARAYMPGFSDQADPYKHRLFLNATLTTKPQQVRAQSWMRSIAANSSLRTAILGKDVLAFSSTRNVSLRLRQENLHSRGAAIADQLEAAEARISALEHDLAKAENYQSYFDRVAAEETDRAEVAEAQHRSAVFRIQQLEAMLTAGGVAKNDSTYPNTWAEFSAWCDANLAGKVQLTPTARRKLKEAAFEDPSLAARCLNWLASIYRDGRINGASGDFRDVYLEDGIRNSPCGTDEFEFDWQGRRYTADWHIKSGGNTRSPQRALRIYYCWHEETQQVLIAEMPGHRDSDAS